VLATPGGDRRSSREKKIDHKVRIFLGPAPGTIIEGGGGGGPRYAFGKRDSRPGG